MSHDCAVSSTYSSLFEPLNPTIKGANIMPGPNIGGILNPGPDLSESELILSVFAQFRYRFRTVLPAGLAAAGLAWGGDNDGADNVRLSRKKILDNPPYLF